MKDSYESKFSRRPSFGNYDFVSALIKGIVIAILFLFPLQITAGPLVIRDNRIRDLGVTPVLGRGYSLATNTFQSTCLTNIVLTEPSYDMTYSFKSLDSFSEITGETSNIESSLYTKAFKNFLDKEEMSGSSEKDNAPTEGERQASKFKGQIKKKRIMVAVDLHSYYASIDESKSKLSSAAIKLLQNRDYPGFFYGCGSYYIRSIGRTARFVSLFKFESISTEEDNSFIYQLETEIKSFRKKIIIDGKEQVIEYTETKKEEQEETFNEKASRLNLTITSAAFGLGKNSKASLISYDLESFKNAIKDAFISMQNPRTGKVTSIEVIPWVENIEFQNVIKLEQSDPIYEEYKDEKGETKKRKKTLLLYEKKYIMNLNAEFLSEIERADRNKLNIYYKAKLCAGQIDANWKRGSKGVRIFKTRNSKSYQDRWVRNNKGDISDVKLKDLDRVLTENNKLERLYLDREKFMNNTKLCMNIMLKKIFTLAYREIKQCRALEKDLAQVEEDIIENYCMPTLHSQYYDPNKLKSKSRQ